MSAAPLPPFIFPYQYMLAIAKWVDDAMDPVLQKYYDPHGIRAVAREEWEKFQTALIMLLLVPLVMAPTRLSIIPTLRHPAYFEQPCDMCKGPGCKGNRIEKRERTKHWVLRAGHHKTDAQTGVMVCPIPSGEFRVSIQPADSCMECCLGHLPRT